MAETVEVKEQKIHKHSRNTKAGISRKTDMVSLGGISITEDGDLIETKMFQFLKLDPEDYADIVFTKEDAQHIHRRLLGVRWGGAAAKTPLMCGGEEICPFSEDCPFVELQRSTGDIKVPVGRKCPIEKELIAFWVARYMQTFDIDPDNQAEVSLIVELAELDIFDYRCSLILSRAENAEMTQEVVVGVDTAGNPISNEEIHKAFEIKERVKKRKHTILESLVGTRKEQYKRDAALKKRSVDDPSTQAAKLKSAIDEARDVLADTATPVGPVHDAEFEEVSD
jgi:hypothetical protein